MAALYMVLGFLALLLLLAWMPVGVRAGYCGDLRVQVRVGPLHFTVYPSEKAGKSRKKSQRNGGKDHTAADAEQKKPFRLPNRRQLAYTADTLLPVLWGVLGRMGRRLRIPFLRLHVTFGGEDPADTAALYGKAQAAAGTVLPALEELICIGETDVRMKTDYQADCTEVCVDTAIEIRLGALAVAGCAALRGVTAWLRGYRALAEEKQSEPSADAAGAA